MTEQGLRGIRSQDGQLDMTYWAPKHPHNSFVFRLNLETSRTMLSRQSALLFTYRKRVVAVRDGRAQLSSTLD
ncbi:hypothetical protein VTN31DRAFT_970 [Thermomyces dupontii]|uniref:uncharacterized protein n=1 Tax=Talaromyces thermophilus TaxID=28565 RepID=UPI0037424991